MSRRPQRNIERPPNYDEYVLEEHSRNSSKRKMPVQETEGAEKTHKARSTTEGKPGSIEWMLSSAKSPLCKVELSRLINQETWACLSDQDREKLSKLLPPTAFTVTDICLPSYHPYSRNLKVQTEAPPKKEHDTESVGREVELSFFNCPFFRSAQVTFQDHLYSGWLTKKHLEDVEKFQKGVEEGTLHAPWKDDLWEEDQREATRGDQAPRQRPSLGSMLSNNIISVRDILAYQRLFPDIGGVVEKDVLIMESPRDGLRVIAPPHDISSLPIGMVLPDAMPPNDSFLQEMVVYSIEELESVILDMHGQIPNELRQGGNSWKRFSLWKHRPGFVSEGNDMHIFGGEMNNGPVFGTRGLREKRGTLFYLRGAYMSNISNLS
ncbi:hypothetical protein CPB86DRAFT_735659 [Serendipita vermifera]|nr:hypothetical protein CPB86DRAFT_735659 [Serendipita vermifera]